MPAARMTPGYFRPIRALLSFVLILTMCRIGEGRVSGPDCDTWKLGVCNPFGLQGKHHVLTSVSANVVAISETRMTKLAKRNLSVGFRSIQSKFKHVLSGAPMSPRSNATWIFWISCPPCQNVQLHWYVYSDWGASLPPPSRYMDRKSGKNLVV